MILAAIGNRRRAVFNQFLVSELGGSVISIAKNSVE